MELASQESIRALMLGYGNPTRVWVRRSTQKAAHPANKDKDRRIRCNCGRCARCLENARWERIFAEKFADPNYYSRPITHTTSPLASL
jgi:hypothetical protein